MTFLFFRVQKRDRFYAESERKKPLLAFALCKIEEEGAAHSGSKDQIPAIDVK